MGIKAHMAYTLNALLAPLDVTIVRRSKLREMQGDPAAFSGPSFSPSALPADSEAYLRPTNPRLHELRQLNLRLDHPAARHSLWTRQYLEKELDLRFFRGDNPYVWQLRGLAYAEMRYVLTAYYIKAIDRLGLLGLLEEDDLFGCHTFTFDEGRVVSRDLLDSVAEINFLDRSLGLYSITAPKVLDIGAGYGRLAHRMVEALPGASVFCTDAVAESTFIAEYYLRFRGVHGSAQIVLLPEIEDTLKGQRVDLAVNIHSFSECRLTAIRWWVELLAKYRVRYLMVVPNPEGKRLLSWEGNGKRLNFEPTISSAGYRLIAKEPKYRDPTVHRYGLWPTYYYLFELDG